MFTRPDTLQLILIPILRPLLLTILLSVGLCYGVDAQLYKLGDTTYLKQAIKDPKVSDKVWTQYLETAMIAREASRTNYINFFEDGMAIARQHNRLKHYYRLLGMRAAIYHSFGDDKSAAKILTQVLDYARTNHDDTTMVYYLIIKARVVARTETYTQGVHLALEALTLSQKLGLHKLEIWSSMLYAHLFGYGGTYRTTLNLYYKARQLAILHKDTLALAFVNNNMANIHNNAHQYDSALACLKVSFAIADKYKIEEMAFVSQMTMSEIYFNQGNNEECLRIAEKVTHREDLEKLAVPLVDIWILQIKASLKLKRYHDVELLCRKALVEFQAQNRRIEANQLWGWLAEALVKTGKMKEASVALDSFFLLGNIYHSDKQARVANELEIKYRDKENALKIANLEASNRSQANITFLLIAVLVLAIGLILIGGILTFQLNKRRQHEQAQRDVIEAQNVQLASLNNSKDRIMGIIAHDLRGPIGTLDHVADMGQDLIEAEDYSTLKNIFRHLKNTTLSLNDLLGNLLDWAVSQEGNLSVRPDEIKIAEVWQKVEGLYQDMASTKNISITTNVADGVVVHADYNSLFTILRNLLNNALKFSTTGGTIVLSAMQEPANITVISIKDNGKGMTSAQLDRLRVADRAQHTRGTAGEKGAGLGMLIVKELLALNKGRIIISSGIDLGTTVKIYLPTTGLTTGPSTVELSGAPATSSIIVTNYLEPVKG